MGKEQQKSFQLRMAASLLQAWRRKRPRSRLTGALGGGDAQAHGQARKRARGSARAAGHSCCCWCGGWQASAARAVTCRGARGGGDGGRLALVAGGGVQQTGSSGAAGRAACCRWQRCPARVYVCLAQGALLRPRVHGRRGAAPHAPLRWRAPQVWRARCPKVARVPQLLDWRAAALPEAAAKPRCDLAVELSTLLLSANAYRPALAAPQAWFRPGDTRASTLWPVTCAPDLMLT